MKPEDVKPNTFKKYTGNSITKGLPDFVKDPKNYMVIEKALLETLACKKTHGDPLQMAECKTCAENMLVRRQLLKRFGFTSREQYFEWRKIMHIMKDRERLRKYND